MKKLKIVPRLLRGVCSHLARQIMLSSHLDFKRALAWSVHKFRIQNDLSHGASSNFASQMVPWPHFDIKIALSRGASSYMDSRNELSRRASSHFASQIVPLWRLLTFRFRRRSSRVERARISLVPRASSCVERAHILF